MKKHHAPIMYGLIGVLIGFFIAYIYTADTRNKAMKMSEKSVTGMCTPAVGHEDHSLSGTEMSMDQMTQELKGKTADAFDDAFTRLMIDHHQGAIEMAQEAQKNAKHDEVKKLADEVITAQEKEIDVMRQWRTNWGYK